MSTHNLIENVYRCRIDFRWTTESDPRLDTEEKVFDRAFQFVSNEPKEVSMETHCGPACFPYVQIESDNRAAVERVAGKIERYIKRLKDVELLP